MMAGEIWTFSEQKDNCLRDVSFELLAWGRRLANFRHTSLCAVVLASAISAEELERLIQHGADKVYLVQNPAFANFLVEPQAHVMQYLVNAYQPEIVLAAATTTGRTVMPYIAMLLHTGLTADCTGLEIEAETGNLLQIRPAIGGNIMATIKTPDTRPQMATVRPKSIAILNADPARQGKILTLDVPAEVLKSRMRFEKAISDSHEHAVLEEANIVISGGLGLRSPEALAAMDELANALGAAIGSSRPPVDQGWQPYVRQVGLSGRTISPALYIACGISGAVQHLAGIQTAKNIIAINSDPEAAIFQVADFGIVGDAVQILPVLQRHIEEDLCTSKKE
jgi:electron transfer flavoprotein alpha subunit